MRRPKGHPQADRHLLVFHDEGIWRSDNSLAPVSTGTRPVARPTLRRTTSINDTAGKAPVIAVPYMVHADTHTATSDPGDPVHSCTGSADYKKASPVSTRSRTPLIWAGRA